MTRRPRTPKGREALSEIDLRLGGLLGSLETAFSEALNRARAEGDAQDVSGEATAGGLQARWSVRVGPAARGRSAERKESPRQPVTPREADHDAVETEDGWVLTVEMPGADPATLSVAPDAAGLRIEASGLRDHRLRLPLPPGASPEGLKARLLNGILEITLPRRSGDETEATR